MKLVCLCPVNADYPKKLLKYNLCLRKKMKEAEATGIEVKLIAATKWRSTNT